MIVNQASLYAIERNLRATFNNAFEMAETFWMDVATRVPSATKIEDYGWLERFPKLERWIGDKNIQSLEAHGYNLENERFASTIEVDRDDIEDDRLGIYRPQAEQAGWSAARWPDELVAEAWNGMFKLPCHDGKPFVATDHPVGDTSVSNHSTVALDASTQAKAIASLGLARRSMRKFRDRQQRPLGVRGTLLCVPPALEEVATLLCEAPKLDDDKPNPYRGTATCEVIDYADSDTAWALLDVSRPVKPFVFQERKAPVMVMQTDPQSDAVFERGKFRFGAEARGAAGFSLWQLCFGSTGTGKV